MFYLLKIPHSNLFEIHCQRTQFIMYPKLACWMEEYLKWNIYHRKLVFKKEGSEQYVDLKWDEYYILKIIYQKYAH